MKRLWVLGIALTAALLLVAGCAGDAGKDGAAGAAGATGATGSTGDSGISTSFDARTLTVNITGASVSSSGVASMTFTVKDQDGFTYANLGNSNAYFNITQLVPASGGNSSKWQSYTNRAKASGAAGTSYDGATTYAKGTIANQAYAEANTYGTFGTLSYSKGVYTYTFKTNLTSVTTPVAVTYNAALTHRVGIELRGLTSRDGETLGADAFYDFVPNGAAVTSTRNIVDTATCNNCHGKLAMHGDGRFQAGYCVQCHNPGTTDPGTNNSLDFKVLIHKVHRSEYLPGVQLKGFAYKILGYSSFVDFSDIAFPVMPKVSIKRKLPGSPTTSQNYPECTMCHVETITTATDAANWTSAPTIETCGSCHDNVRFDIASGEDSTWEILHTAGIKTNAECATCHTPTNVEAKHSVYQDLNTAIGKVQFNIKSATYAAGKVTVTFNATDPTASTTAFYDIMNPATASTSVFSPFYRTASTATPPWTGAGMTVKVAWGSKEHVNDNNGSATDVARSAQASVVGTTPDASLAAVAGNDCAGTTQCDFTVDVVVPATEFTAKSGFTVGIEGHPGYNVDLNGGGTLAESLPVRSVVKDFNADGTAASSANKRREVVDAAKCAKCHVNLALHGGNRNYEPLYCATCHHSNNTDAEGRDNGAGLVIGGTTATNLDGKYEETIDLKVMIHGIHAAAQTSLDGSKEYHGMREKGLVINGDWDSSEIRYPGVLRDCETCHKSGTYGLPLNAAVLPTSINGSSNVPGSPPTAAYSIDYAGDPTNDINVTPTSAVCSSCHDGFIPVTHMKTFGGNFALVGDTINTGVNDTELCEMCHGETGVVGVEKVHKPSWK